MKNFTHLKEFTDILLSIEPPFEITRVPEKISDQLKAHQWKHFTLYYSLPCLVKFMKRKYLNHWHKFVYGLYIFSKEPSLRKSINQQQKHLKSLLSPLKSCMAKSSANSMFIYCCTSQNTWKTTDHCEHRLHFHTKDLTV